MKNCYKFKSLISNYIDKEISFRDRRFFESHKSQCADCKALFNNVAATKNHMHTMPSVTVSNTFMDSLRKKILDDRNSRILASQNQGFSLRRIPAFAYGFSSVLVLVIVGFIMLQLPTNSPVPAQQLPLTAQEKLDDAKQFQQKFDATPAYLKSENLANTPVDSGVGVNNDPARNFENNLNKVDYKKK
jgi:hypothetical protein